MNIRRLRALPSLRQLRYLVEVARTLHFGHAAEACLVTQSTLSAGIAELEATLGVILLERQARRRVVLTPVGEEIVERARALLADAEALLDTATARTEPLSGDLRLGVIPTIGPYVLPEAVAGARVSYPRLRLYLREEQSAALIASVTSGRLDVGLLALPYDIDNLVSLPLWEEDVVLLVPRGHPLAEVATIDDLTGADLILLEDGHCLRGHALTACGLDRGRAGVERFQATSLQTLVQMVAGGLGVTLVPRPAASVLAAGVPNVVVRDLTFARPARTVALVWRPGSPRAAEFRVLGDMLRAQMPRLPALR